MTKETIDSDQLHDHVLNANNQANEFARTGLANIMLLNGGAIVAFAPIGSMFNVNVALVLGFALLSLGAFVAGLLAAVGAFLIGFFVNSRLSDIMFARIGGEEPEKVNVLVDDHNQLRAWGIFLAIVGVACFVAGAGVGGLALYYGSPTS